MEYNIEESTFFKGGKRGIILLHAYTGSPNDVLMLGRFLNKQGYSVHLPTFTGHKEHKPENILAATTKDWLEDVEKSLALFTRQGIEEVAIFGLSLGGVYAYASLEKFPAKVIGGGAFCSPLNPETKNNIVPVFLDFAKEVITKECQTTIEIQRRMENVRYQLEKQLNQLSVFQAEVYQNLAEIKQPCFFGQGMLDELVNPEAAFELKGKLVKTTLELIEYPKSGHVLTVGPERQQLQTDVLQFVNRLNWTEELE